MMGKTFEYMLPSREEAKEQSLRAVEKRSELTSAIQSIKEAITEGKFNCDVDLKEDGSISYLKERGYEISSLEERNYKISSAYRKCLYKVSWN